MLSIIDIEAFDKARKEIMQQWEEHKKTTDCTGDQCPICIKFKEDYDDAQPRD